MLKTFTGGIRLAGHKEATANSSIEIPSLPEQVIVPLIQYGGRLCEPLVKTGERVKTGQLIGLSQDSLSVAAHSSISGKVARIGEFVHPDFEKARAILIESDGLDEKAWEAPEKDYQDLSREELLNRIRNAGVVGMGGASFPTHVKLNPPRNKKIDFFVVNMFECEPYITTDYRLAIEKCEEILSGVNIFLKILEIETAYIAIGADKKEALDILKEKAAKFERIKIAALKPKFPQGEEKCLIKAVLNKEVPRGKLPYEAGAIVCNPQTIITVYEAVCLGKPLYEKVITVTGKGIKKPGNLKVRIGTLLKDIIEYSGGVFEDEMEVIFGGPMMGRAQIDINVPVVKGTSGIVFLPAKSLDLSKESACIRCGRCVEVCPVRLLPLEINKLVKNKKWERLNAYYISECMLCGACAYVCPSKIPLVQRLKLGQKVTERLKGKNRDAK